MSNYQWRIQGFGGVNCPKQGWKDNGYKMMLRCLLTHSKIRIL